jgi:hypothetical protein
MNRKSKSRQVVGNMTLTLDESRAKNYAEAVQRAFESNAEYLLWVAEVMTGDRQAGEQCVSEAIELAEAAQEVGTEWILRMVKRLLVHVALRRMSAEIRAFLLPPRSGLATISGRPGLSESERLRIRVASPREIIASCDVFERTCFILSAHLQYPLLDCALLLGVPRHWIEPVCERAIAKIVDVARSPTTVPKVLSYSPHQESWNAQDTLETDTPELAGQEMS